MLPLPLPLPLLTMVDDAGEAIELVDPFEALDDFLCFDDDVAEEELLGSPGNRLLDFMLLFPLPLLILLPPGCCCIGGGGSSSFSGDDGPSLELVS